MALTQADLKVLNLSDRTVDADCHVEAGGYFFTPEPSGLRVTCDTIVRGGEHFYRPMPEVMELMDQAANTSGRQGEGLAQSPASKP